MMRAKTLYIMLMSLSKSNFHKKEIYVSVQSPQLKIEDVERSWYIRVYIYHAILLIRWTCYIKNDNSLKIKCIIHISCGWSNRCYIWWKDGDTKKRRRIVVAVSRVDWGVIVWLIAHGNMRIWKCFLRCFWIHQASKNILILTTAW